MTPNKIMTLTNSEHGLEDVKTSEMLGDFILWNSLEDRPSYQLVSCYHDIEDNIDLIIRGKDLIKSTFSQEVIRDITEEGKERTKCTYFHHNLLTSEGVKLSKSVHKNL